MEVFCPSGFPSGTVVCNIWFQLALLACVLAPIGIMVWFYGRFSVTHRQAANIRANGIRTTGVLQRFDILNGTPNGVAGQIPVRIHVLVQPSGEAPYAAHCIMLVNPWRLSALIPGQTVTVFYDAQNRSRIAVDESN
ncbi:MAG: hypothetical protein FJ040_12270 [Chloroflexi bacterium]|nr:hypothetical protein [Chloroflexota bacterium]